MNVISTDSARSLHHRSCPICGSVKRRPLFRDRNRREGYQFETDLVICKVCGMRYLTPVPCSDFWLREYVNLYCSSAHRTVHHSLIVQILDLILGKWNEIWSRDMIYHEIPFGQGENRKILDIGCGSGAKLKTYEKRGFEVFGLDLVPESITDAKSYVNGTFYVGDFEKIELPVDFFDFVRFDNVLEHIYNPENFLEKVYCLLKPGGIAYGYVPNGLSPTMQIMGKYSISSWVPFHINLFTPSCFRELASKVGFKARVKGISYSHWVMQSVRQWRFRNSPSYDETEFDWIDRLVRAAVSPLWWLFTKVWQGEELMLIAQRLK